MSQRRSVLGLLPQDPRTTTVMKDEQGRIDLITEKNQEWAEEFQLLLKEYQGIKDHCEDVECKYRDTQKENSKIKTHLDLTQEKWNREKRSWVNEKEKLEDECDKLRKELREKGGKV